MFAGCVTHRPLVWTGVLSFEYILNEDTQPVIRAIGVSHTTCKDEVRQNIRSHSWMECISFFLINTWYLVLLIVPMELVRVNIDNKKFSTIIVV